MKRVFLLLGAIIPVVFINLAVAADSTNTTNTTKTTTCPAGQSVDFVALKDGETVKSPFTAKFAVTGMEVKPAGTMEANTGHHHLLIDQENIVKAGDVIPADDKHIHFGKGQTETEVTLAPGKHKLTMLFANGAHQSYGECMSKTINVIVK